MENVIEQKRDISECPSVWGVLLEHFKFAGADVSDEISDAYAEAVKRDGYLDL